MLKRRLTMSLIMMFQLSSTLIEKLEELGEDVDNYKKVMKNITEHIKEEENGVQLTNN